MPGTGTMLRASLDAEPPAPPDESDGLLKVRRRDAPGDIGMVELAMVLPLHVLLANLLPAVASAPAPFPPITADNP